MSRSVKSIGALLLGLLLAGATQAEDVRYPQHAVKILVPFSAGALTDIVARLYAERLSPRLGQPVVVENRPGSGGVVASQAVLGAAPDGHTLLFVSSAHAVNPSFYPNLPYDTRRDFSGIALVAMSPSLVIVAPTLGVKTLADLISYAKRNPGALNFGSAGAGSATHLGGEYLRAQAQIDMVHIPYKGVQEAVAEVMAGRIHIAFPPIALALAQVRAGRVQALAVTSAQRTPLLPDVPTAREAGLGGFEYGIWYALVAPSKTPRATLDLLAGNVRQITELPEIRERMFSQGLIPQSLYLKEFDAYIAAEIDKLGRLVKASGAKPD